MPRTTSQHLPASKIKHPSAGPRTLCAFLGLFLLLAHPPGARAQDLSRTYQTRYTSIYYGSEKDLFHFTRNIASGMSFLAESPEKNPLLARNRVDKIVDMVGSLLDMRPSNLRFGIYLYKSRAEVEAAYKSQGMLGPAPPAFYSHRTRSIAVSIDDITDRMLAHEIAHATICFYFGTPPPARMQEVLAQYVDKHLGEE